jgi:FAD/FMN-containing dehydrogenase
VAVVRPKILLELWRALKACVKYDAVVIMLAQNTCLTDGASPDAGYDRPVIIINTLKLDGIQLEPIRRKLKADSFRPWLRTSDNKSRGYAAIGVPTPSKASP